MAITAPLCADVDVAVPTRDFRGVENGERQRPKRRVGSGDLHQTTPKNVHDDVPAAADLFIRIWKDRKQLSSGEGVAVPTWIRRVVGAKRDTHAICMRVFGSSPRGGLNQSVRLDHRSVDADIMIYPQEETLIGRHGLHKE